MSRRLVFAAALAACTLPVFAQEAANCPQVKLTTSMGAITIALDAAKAPNSVRNFVGYVKSGHYDGTVFHRVIDGFMIQGGGYTADMNQKPTKPPIAIESKNGLHNGMYTVAMARTNDPNSATSQFFINVVDNARLDYAGEMQPGYTVFGRVTGGTDVVDKIRKVPTGSKMGMQNVPNDPVTIQKAECIASDGKAEAKSDTGKADAKK